jgi:hypothetical protein
MRQRLSLLIALTSCLLATGTHWDLIQTFAWGRMLVNSSQSMSLAAAVKNTFTPSARCSLCRAVAKAKHPSEQGPTLPGSISSGKILLLGTLPTVVLFSPSPHCVGRLPKVIASTGAWRAAPPSRPPRAVV